MGSKLGIRRVVVTSALVVLVATGCGGPTPDPAAFDAPPETATTATTEATVPATTVPTTTARVLATKVPVPKAPAAPPKKAPPVVRAAPTPRPSHPALVQGSDPVVWLSAMCGGLNEGFAATSAIENSQPSTPQEVKDQLLQLSDAVQQAFTNTAHKLAQLGPPGVPGGKQAQDTLAGFLATAAATVRDSRGKFAALDVNDPDFVQKADQLATAEIDALSTEPPGVTSNQELAPELLAIPECAKMATNMAHP